MSHEIIDLFKKNYKYFFGLLIISIIPLIWIYDDIVFDPAKFYTEYLKLIITTGILSLFSLVLKSLFEKQLKDKEVENVKQTLKTVIDSLLLYFQQNDINSYSIQWQIFENTFNKEKSSLDIEIAEEVSTIKSLNISLISEIPNPKEKEKIQETLTKIKNLLTQ